MVTAQPLASASFCAASRMALTSVRVSTDFVFMVFSLGCQGFVDNFDPVPHRCAACAVEVGLAANIGGDDQLRVTRFKVVELVVTQLHGELGLGDRIGARRAAAEVGIGHRGESEAELDQYGLHCAVELLRVLQGAGAVESKPATSVDFEILQRLVAQYFDQILGQRADAFRLLGISRVILEDIDVLFHKSATAAGGLHDGFRTRFDMGPPGVDVGSCPGATVILSIEVEVDGTTAAGFGYRSQADTQAVKHPCGGGVGIGRKPRLYTPFENQHLPCVALMVGARAGIYRFGRQHFLELARYQRLEGLAQLEQCLEALGFRQCLAEYIALGTVGCAAGNTTLDFGATDVEQLVVLHSGGAGGFTVAAGQAAVQVQSGLLGDVLAVIGVFQHLLHQVDAAPWSVTLVAQQLIGGAGGVTEAAVHTATQDAVGFLNMRLLEGFLGKVRLHVEFLYVSERRVEPAGIEDPLGVELGLEVAVIFHQHLGQRRERLHIGSTRAIAGSVTTCRLAGAAYGVGTKLAA